MKRKICLVMMIIMTFGMSGCAEKSIEELPVKETPVTTQPDTIDQTTSVVEISSPVTEMKAYDAAGTGPIKPEDYAPSDKKDCYYIWNDSGYVLTITEDTVTSDETGETYTYQKITGMHLTCLNNTDLQDEINEKLDAMIDRLNQDCNNNPQIILDGVNAYDSGDNRDKDIAVQIVNGYMSITIGYLVDLKRCGIYAWERPEYFTHYWLCETLCYDLIEGRELTSLSDLFYQRVDVDQTLNNALSKTIEHFYSEIYATNITTLKQDAFSELLGEQNKFSLTEVWFPEDNPYFVMPVMMMFDDYTMRDDCIINQYRDTGNLFNEEGLLWIRDIEKFEYSGEKHDGVLYATVIDSRFYSKEEVAARNEVYICIQDKTREYLGDNPAGWFIYEGEHTYTLTNDPGTMECEYISFSKDTLEVVKLDEVLAEGWQEAVDYQNERMEEHVAKHRYSDVIFCVRPKGDTATEIVLFSSESQLSLGHVLIPNEYIDFSKVL